MFTRSTSHSIQLHKQSENIKRRPFRLPPREPVASKNATARRTSAPVASGAAQSPRGKATILPAARELEHACHAKHIARQRSCAATLHSAHASRQKPIGSGGRRRDQLHRISYINAANASDGNYLVIKFDRDACRQARLASRQTDSG